MTDVSDVMELLEETTNLVKSIEAGMAVTPEIVPLSTAALRLLLKYVVIVKMPVVAVEGGLVMPLMTRVKVWAGMLLLVLFRLVIVRELPEEVYRLEGEEAIPLPVRVADEEEDSPKLDGKLMTKNPPDVIGSATVIEKV